MKEKMKTWPQKLRRGREIFDALERKNREN